MFKEGVVNTSKRSLVTELQDRSLSQKRLRTEQDYASWNNKKRVNAENHRRAWSGLSMERSSLSREEVGVTDLFVSSAPKETERVAAIKTRFAATILRAQLKKLDRVAWEEKMRSNREWWERDEMLKAEAAAEEEARRLEKEEESKKAQKKMKSATRPPGSLSIMQKQSLASSMRAI